MFSPSPSSSVDSAPPEGRGEQDGTGRGVSGVGLCAARQGSMEWRVKMVQRMLFVLALGSSLLGGTARAGGGVAGHWEGEILAPGAALELSVDIEGSDGDWRGFIDIPQQGVSHLRLQDIEVVGKKVAFTIARMPQAPRFEGKVKKGRMSGIFRQGDAAPTDFWMTYGVVDRVRRPQEPREPYRIRPYRSSSSPTG